MPTSREAWQGLLIDRGALTRVDIDHDRDGATSIHNLIGDTFSSAFTLPGQGRSHLIVGYCDDNFMAKPRAEVPWNVMLDRSVYAEGWPIAGPLVVTAAHGDRTADLTELEMSALRIVGTAEPQPLWDLADGPVRMPLLIFRPGYDIPRAMAKALGIRHL